MKRIGIGLGSLMVGILVGLFSAAPAQSGQQKVRLVRDIDFVADHASNNGMNRFEPNVQGTLKEGSIGIVTMRKGSLVYLEFPIVLFAKDVEDIH